MEIENQIEFVETLIELRKLGDINVQECRAGMKLAPTYALIFVEKGGC